MMRTLTTMMLVAVCSLAGCSLLPKAEVQTRYALQPVTGATISMTPQTGLRAVRVTRPQVPVANQGNRLVLLDGNEVTYYAGAGWSADLTDMLAAALVRDLATSVPGAVVSGADSAVSADLEVQLDVRTWATVRTRNGNVVVMDADVRVVEPNSRKVLRNLPFRYRQALPELTTAATLDAFDQGWQQLVSQTAQMVAGTPLRDERRRS